MNYNIKPVTIINQPYLETVDAAIHGEINHWYECLKEVVPRGFQATVEIKDLDSGAIDYSTGILQAVPSCSGKISGSFAQVKLDTLHRFPSLAMTGTWTIDELIAVIRDIKPDYDTLAFSNLENACQLTRAQHEKLRREIGITAYLGGIRAPFTRTVSILGEGRKTESKEACITFSALTGEEDLYMCCYILRELQTALVAATPNATYVFDLSQLKANPIANFNLMMNGVLETPKN